jgi:hypothetical protein
MNEKLSKSYIGVMQNIRYSCHVLMKLEFSSQIFKKLTKIKFHDNTFSEA